MTREEFKKELLANNKRVLIRKKGIYTQAIVDHEHFPYLENFLGKVWIDKEKVLENFANYAADQLEEIHKEAGYTDSFWDNIEIKENHVPEYGC